VGNQWRGRLSRRRGRYFHAGRPRGVTTEGRCVALADGQARSGGRLPTIQHRSDHYAVRGILRGRPGAMKILAAGPHPDDIEFGCAPLLIQEVQKGHTVRLAITTQGEASTAGTPEERDLEARAAAAEIGAEIEFLDMGGDCHI